MSMERCSKSLGQGSCGCGLLSREEMLEDASSTYSGVGGKGMVSKAEQEKKPDPVRVISSY